MYIAPYFSSPPRGLINRSPWTFSRSRLICTCPREVFQWECSRWSSGRTALQWSHPRWRTGWVTRAAACRSGRAESGRRTGCIGSKSAAPGPAGWRLSETRAEFSFLANCWRKLLDTEKIIVAINKACVALEFLSLFSYVCLRVQTLTFLYWLYRRFGIQNNK